MPSDAILSVITISYHDPAGLARTLDSVAAQTYAPLEHIVIDGGSGPIVEKMLGDAQPSYWQSRADGGRYDAMNQGVDRATGDVVWLMHSGDCFAEPDSAATGMTALRVAGSLRDRWGYGRARIVGDPVREGIEWGYSPFEMRNFALGIRPIPHQAVLFGTTSLFLERLGLNSLDELPPLGDFVPGPDVVEALEAGLRVNEDSAHDAPAQSAAHEAAAHEAAAHEADEPVIDLRDQAPVNEAPLSLDALDVLADD